MPSVLGHRDPSVGQDPHGGGVVHLTGLAALGAKGPEELAIGIVAQDAAVVGVGHQQGPAGLHEEALGPALPDVGQAPHPEELPRRHLESLHPVREVDHVTGALPVIGHRAWLVEPSGFQALPAEDGDDVDGRRLHDGRSAAGAKGKTAGGPQGGQRERRGKDPHATPPQRKRATSAEAGRSRRSARLAAWATRPPIRTTIKSEIRSASS